MPVARLTLSLAASRPRASGGPSPTGQVIEKAQNGDGRLFQKCRFGALPAPLTDTIGATPRYGWGRFCFALRSRVFVRALPSPRSAPYIGLAVREGGYGDKLASE
jgi:hypothetical protein